MGDKKTATKYPGVRYREHSTRKHGVKRDRYYSIRYRVDGRYIEECLGWSSEGWTAEKANHVRGQLMEAKRTGNGPRTLQEKREQEERMRMEQERLARAAAGRDITFGQYFDQIFYPRIQRSTGEDSHKKHQEHYDRWIKEHLENIRLADMEQDPLLADGLLGKILDSLQEAKRSPRTIEYVFATIRQTWNNARKDSIVAIPSPTKKITLPKFDNERFRYLSEKEADDLLANLQKRHLDTHDMALLSLQTGIREDEVYSLLGVDIHRDEGFIQIKDTKSGKNRVAYITEDIDEMLDRRGAVAPDELIFKRRDGSPYSGTPWYFRQAVTALGYNNGVKDRRDRVVFHTLRHTFASWQVSAGMDLYKLQKLMGHKSISQTQRYAHLAPKTLQGAVKIFNKRRRKRKKQTIKPAGSALPDKR